MAKSSAKRERQIRAAALTKAEAAKRSAGRYTLEEADRMFSSATEERQGVLMEKLRTAATAGLIPMYEPGSRQRIVYGREVGQHSRVRTFYEEAYWNDLNTWLKKNETRIEFRYPNPEIDGTNAPAQINTQSKQQEWNARFVTAIEQLGLDLKALPPGKNGYPGVRSRVAKALRVKVTNRAFATAWARALADEVLAYSTE